MGADAGRRRLLPPLARLAQATGPLFSGGACSPISEPGHPLGRQDADAQSGTTGMNHIRVYNPRGNWATDEGPHRRLHAPLVPRRIIARGAPKAHPPDPLDHWDRRAPPAGPRATLVAIGRTVDRKASRAPRRRARQVLRGERVAVTGGRLRRRQTHSGTEADRIVTKRASPKDGAAIGADILSSANDRRAASRANRNAAIQPRPSGTTDQDFF